MTMFPRYKPGEIAYVAPNTWPSLGQDCFLELEGGGVEFGELVERASEHLVLRQCDPAGDRRISKGDWLHIHAVVGRG